MKKDFVELAIGLMALIVGGAAEELLPKFAGVGLPFLLMATLYLAMRRRPAGFFIFAVASGAMEDSLCSLPFATSIAFFTLAAAFLHWAHLERCTFAFAFPAYQLWLRMWTGSLHGGVFARFLVSIPAGAVAAGIAYLALTWLDRKGALDEQ